MSFDLVEKIRSARAGAAFAAVALAVAVALAGCGSGDSGGSGGARQQLVVSAASSLTGAFEQYAKRFGVADVKYSFAGSDALAAQIEQGAKPDVFASANTKLPARLYAKGLVEKPVVFAANRLVIAVSGGDANIKSIDDLAAPGVTIAAGSASVPVGAYTDKTLAKLPAKTKKAVEANIRSREPDVKGVVGKLTTGAVDAGFVYVTDVKAAGGKLRAIELPASLQPRVDYGVAIVKASKNPAAAQKFIDGLLSGDGANALAQAGFEPPGK